MTTSTKGTGVRAGAARSVAALVLVACPAQADPTTEEQDLAARWRGSATAITLHLGAGTQWSNLSGLDAELSEQGYAALDSVDQSLILGMSGYSTVVNMYIGVEGFLPRTARGEADTVEVEQWTFVADWFLRAFVVADTLSVGALLGMSVTLVRVNGCDGLAICGKGRENLGLDLGAKAEAWLDGARIWSVATIVGYRAELFGTGWSGLRGADEVHGPDIDTSGAYVRLLGGVTLR